MSFSSDVSDFFKKNGSDFGSSSAEANHIITSKYSVSPPRGAEEIFSGDLKPGKIYLFDYVTDTKLGGKRNYINLMPIAVYSEYKKDTSGEIIDFFIDLTVTPPKNRMEILSEIYEKNSSIIASNKKDPNKTQEPLDLRYSTIKGYLQKSGFNISYTGFKRKGLRNIRLIEYPDWSILPYVTTSKIIGDSVSEIYRKYQSKLNSGTII